MARSVDRAIFIGLGLDLTRLGNALCCVLRVACCVLRVCHIFRINPSWATEATSSPR